MDFFVYQTENNIVGATGLDAQGGREFYTSPRIDTRGKSPLRSFVDSGFTLSSGGGTTCTVATGVAMIEGFLVKGLTSTFSLSGLTTVATYYVFLKLIVNGSTGLVDSATIEANITGTPPAHSVLLGILSSNGSALSNFRNSAPAPHPYPGQYTGDGATNRLIFLGWPPKFVILSRTVFTASDYHFVFSGIAQGASVPGFRILAGASAGATGSTQTDTSATRRPELQALGFLVSGNNALEINIGGQVWNYLAFP